MAALSPRPRICLVTPALAGANNGNWQTARRWRALLSPHARVRLASDWPDGAAAQHDAVLIALHARRSAAAVAAWRTQRPTAPLVVVLTGTDLYREIAHDATAIASLHAATRLVVLQPEGVSELPEALRPRSRVILQSTSAWQPLPRSSTRLFRAVAVGHLRAEKDPLALMAAARLLAPDEGICIDHIGGALDPELAEAAQATAQACPHYRWLGPLPHAQARRRIQRAHVLVHPSRLEGGAHVIMEAVCSGTPVLASRVPGNVGMLGSDHPAYVPPGDPAALAAALRYWRDARHAGTSAWHALIAQSRHQAQAFRPERERADLCALLSELL